MRYGYVSFLVNFNKPYKNHTSKIIAAIKSKNITDLIRQKMHSFDFTITLVKMLFTKI